MAVVFSLSRRPLDELEDRLVEHARRLNAAEYAFLCLVREFDLRQGWKRYLFNSCAEWLNMKCGIVVGTAREKVRVAMALFDLPEISQAFAEGALSYSKVRSLTRVATPQNEAELLAYARTATAGQVQACCLRLRNADRAVSTGEAHQAYRSRSLSRSVDGDGRMRLSVALPAELGELVMQALELAMARAERDTATAAAEPSRDASANASTDDAAGDALFTRQADALVDIARAYLAGDDTKPTSSAERYQVVVHVDEAALREAPDTDARSDLPLESVRRLCCDGSIVPLIEDDTGRPLHLGRKHRAVPPALRKALFARDRGCCYPGCTHTRWLDAHHVMHWLDGGETSLENTLLLCSRHHRLLHEGGYQIKTNHRGEWYFETADGKVLSG